jgi:HEAT repeat protein
MRHRRIKAVSAILTSLIICIGTAIAQDLPTLLSRFQSEGDIATKEVILYSITKDYPNSGSALLKIARQTKDSDTRWLAIRGIGSLKFHDATPFLKQSLRSESTYVRANAARTLGEIGDLSAAPALIGLLKSEQNNGVIEQTTLALQMLGAKAAVPVLKDRVVNPSAQTRMWILGAIEVLDSKKDVPFFATFLSDNDENVAALAAHVIERFTGEDFGFPRCAASGPCAYGYGVRNAQSWWNTHKQSWVE